MTKKSKIEKMDEMDNRMDCMNNESIPPNIAINLHFCPFFLKSHLCEKDLPIISSPKKMGVL